MDESPPPGYRREFWRSRPHVWMALGTLGLGFASGNPLGLLCGGAAYALGLLYLPDMPWFRRQVDERRTAAARAIEAARQADFERQQAQLLAALSAGRRQRHDALVAVCRDITAATASPSGDALVFSQETRTGKIAELRWTYLRLLSIEQTLEVFLETERREHLPESCAEAEREVEALAAEIQAAGATPALEARRKLLQSRRDRLAALRQRLQHVEQARANLELARSEQDRLVEQVKLIRADALANRNAEALTARIDLSIEHLAETNRWLADLAAFKDLTGNATPLPPAELSAAPAAPVRTKARQAPPALQK